MKTAAWLCLGSALFALQAHADDTVVTRWLDQSLPGYLEIYRDLHQHPELSLQEQRTAGIVARELKRYGYAVTPNVGGTGVVAVLRNGPGRTVLLRGDMDALPVSEETGLAYASQVHAKDDTGQSVPVMHACGHDVHVTNLLATAAWLAKQHAAWGGTLVIVAQPAEELGEGALRMMKDGLFERFPKPDYALALHVDPELPSGALAVASGWAAANADAVDVTLYGRGGHGSRPQDTVDPIVLSAQFVTALQTLVSRRIDPQEAAVVTVGAIHGGTKRNVIPESVSMLLTVRSYSDEVRQKLLTGISQLARDLSNAFGSPKPPDIHVKETYTPAVYNDPNLAESAMRVFRDTFGAAAVSVARAPMTAEDFGRFGKTLQIPSLLIRLGATPKAAYDASLQPGAAPLPSLHSPRFSPDTPLAIRTGVRALSALVMSLLPRQAPSLAVSQ